MFRSRKLVTIVVTSFSHVHGIICIEIEPVVVCLLDMVDDCSSGLKKNQSQSIKLGRCSELVQSLLSSRIPMLLVIALKYSGGSFRAL